MYSTVDSHLWMSLILTHLREGPYAVFGIITRVHIPFKKPTKNCS